LYDSGKGVHQDSFEAVKWYRKAAEQGIAAAQANLGNMYAQGKGVPQDYVKAHKWYNLAGAGGNNQGKQNRDVLEKKMTPSQVTEAQKLASEWKPKTWKELSQQN